MPASAQRVRPVSYAPAPTGLQLPPPPSRQYSGQVRQPSTRAPQGGGQDKQSPTLCPQGRTLFFLHPAPPAAAGRPPRPDASSGSIYNVSTARNEDVFSFKTKNYRFSIKKISKTFGRFRKTIYICISKNDKYIMNNEKTNLNSNLKTLNLMKTNLLKKALLSVFVRHPSGRRPYALCHPHRTTRHVPVYHPRQRQLPLRIRQRPHRPRLLQNRLPLGCRQPRLETGLPLHRQLRQQHQHPHLRRVERGRRRLYRPTGLAKLRRPTLPRADCPAR